MTSTQVLIDDKPQFSPDPAEPLRFLNACPAYRPTPLVKIEDNSGLTLVLKDETSRLGQRSFKGLGGVYAVAKLIAVAWEKKTGKALQVESLTSEAVRDVARSMTFVCASAGNHGLAVAAGANIFGASARIYLSGDVPNTFEAELSRLGAQVIRCGLSYEDSMEGAAADVEQTGAILLADSAWAGYTGPPSLIMEGYSVLAEELRLEFDAMGKWPTDVFLQAGVGGLAGAATYMIRKTWTVQPRIFIVEPQSAACLQASDKAGYPVRVTGPVSNMGRLDCKEASLIAVEILRNASVNYITIADAAATSAAEFLQSNGLSTTPSGAAGLAGFWQALPTIPRQKEIRPLIIISEGTW